MTSLFLYNSMNFFFYFYMNSCRDWSQLLYSFFWSVHISSRSSFAFFFLLHRHDVLIIESLDKRIDDWLTVCKEQRGQQCLVSFTTKRSKFFFPLLSSFYMFYSWPSLFALLLFHSHSSSCLRNQIKNFKVQVFIRHSLMLIWKLVPMKNEL